MRCSITALAATEAFRYVVEQEDEFLALFPHRFDFIYAEHPEPSQSPQWQTESRYPLSDRLILEGSALYGVRFSSQTRYCLLDIDTGSAYHPQSDPFAIGRIMAALEPLGFTTSLSCQSSYRGGIHLYLPFQEAQSSWDLAACAVALLESKGFKLKPGQLELFPNPRRYSVGGKPALFNAHRLPMQAGFYLLNQDFQPVWGDRSTFVRQWHFAASRNQISARVLRQLLKQHRRKHYRVSGKADKFLHDLDIEIEQGWTGHGQTNRLLGRIALRTYIFHHVLQGCDPLTGQDLADQIAAIARSLPGYRDWCRHQHEIEERAAEWARCVENSRYFHYTQHSAVQTESSSVGSSNRISSWNQRQAEITREKIRGAIADLLEKNCLPAKATARFQALVQYAIGGGSLYRHRDLWHPDYLRAEMGTVSCHSSLKQDCESSDLVDTDFPVENSSSVENPPHPPTSSSARPSDHLGTDANGLSCTSLFPDNGGNASQGHESSDRLLHRDLDRTYSIDRLYQFRMQQYLNSGDPILIAEAKFQQQHDRNVVDRNLVDRDTVDRDTVDRNLVESFAESSEGDVDLSTLQSPSLPQIPSVPVRSGSAYKELNRGSIADLAPQSFLQDSHSNSSQDLSDLLVGISVEIRRLRWTDREICDRLYHRYCKTSRALLTEAELFDWLSWLRTQKLDGSRSL